VFSHRAFQFQVPSQAATRGSHAPPKHKHHPCCVHTEGDEHRVFPLSSCCTVGRLAASSCCTVPVGHLATPEKRESPGPISKWSRGQSASRRCTRTLFDRLAAAVHSLHESESERERGGGGPFNRGSSSPPWFAGFRVNTSGTAHPITHNAWFSPWLPPPRRDDEVGVFRVVPYGHRRRDDRAYTSHLVRRIR
jgi:hypothetical protein